MLEVDVEKLPDWVRTGYKIKDLQEPAVRQRLGKDMQKFVLSVRTQNLDSLVFLDKSARPAAWMFREMWHLMYPEVRTPDVHFVNIGRERRWRWTPRFTAPSQWPEYVAQRARRDTEFIAEVEKAFKIGKGHDSRGQRIVGSETYFDDKTVWVVDEIAQEGKTLAGAQAIFQEAFGTRIKGKVGGVDIFREAPPWYTLDPKEKDLWREDLIGVWELNHEAVFTKPWNGERNTNFWLRNELSLIVQQAVAASP